MKPGHRSEDDYAGYDVCNNAVLGHLRKEKKKDNSMPFLQKNLHISASVRNSLKPMKKFLNSLRVTGN